MLLRVALPLTLGVWASWHMKRFLREDRGGFAGLVAAAVLAGLAAAPLAQLAISWLPEVLGRLTGRHAPELSSGERLYDSLLDTQVLVCQIVAGALTCILSCLLVIFAGKFWADSTAEGGFTISPHKDFPNE